MEFIIILGRGFSWCGRKIPWTGGICELCVIYCLAFILIHFHRQIFGSLPTNVDDEDVINPVVSSLNILKEQRACKATVRHQSTEASSHISNSRSPEPKGAHVAASTSKIPPPSSPSADQRSWDFSNEPIPSRNPQTSTSQRPHTSTSADNDTHTEPPSEPQGHLSQQPNAEQTQPAPQQQSSPVWHPGCHPPHWTLSPETTQTAPTATIVTCLASRTSPKESITFPSLNSVRVGA